MSPRSYSSVRRLTVVVAWASLAGCTGQIGSTGDPATDPLGPNGPGPGGPGGPGSTPSGPPPTDPGRVTMHRLNRAEYNNTVRDLLGSSLTPADDFTADNRSDGFDNIAEFLTLAPIQMQQYQQAAEKLSDEAIGPNRSRNVTCDTAADACVQTTIKNLATKAWRRPVQDSELTPLLGLVTTAKGQGDTADVGLKL